MRNLVFALFHPHRKCVLKMGCQIHPFSQNVTTQVATLCTQVADNLYNSLILKELLDLTSNFKIIKNQILKPFCA